MARKRPDGVCDCWPPCTEHPGSLIHCHHGDAPEETDCRHGCNGDCVVTGSLQCDFTCHDNEIVTMAKEAWAERPEPT